MRLEIVETGRRRRFSDAEKVRIVEESFTGWRQATATARRYGICTSLLYRWRALWREGRLGVPPADNGSAPAFVPAVIVPDDPQTRVDEEPEAAPAPAETPPRSTLPHDPSLRHPGNRQHKLAAENPDLRSTSGRPGGSTGASPPAAAACSMVGAASTGGAPPVDYRDDLLRLTPWAQNPVHSGGHYWAPKGVKIGCRLTHGDATGTPGCRPKRKRRGHGGPVRTRWPTSGTPTSSRCWKRHRASSPSPCWKNWSGAIRTAPGHRPGAPWNAGSGTGKPWKGRTRRSSSARPTRRRDMVALEKAALRPLPRRRTLDYEEDRVPVIAANRPS